MPGFDTAFAVFCLFPFRNNFRVRFPASGSIGLAENKQIEEQSVKKDYEK